jgi:hypothetical protein
VSAYPERRRANSKPPQFVERASKEINWPPIRWFEVSTDHEGNYRPLIAMPYRRSLTCATHACCATIGCHWDAAAHTYARDHDRYYWVTHKVDGWFKELLLRNRRQAATRR